MLLATVAAAAADCDAGFLQLMEALPLLIMMRWLEMMGLLGMKREMMPVAKERSLDRSGAVRQGLALQPLAVEGLRVAVWTPLLPAHLWGAGAFICGLHLSVHPWLGGMGQLWRAGRDKSRQSPLSGSVSHALVCEMG